jgi:hypothetical protein
MHLVQITNTVAPQRSYQLKSLHPVRYPDNPVRDGSITFTSDLQVDLETPVGGEWTVVVRPGAVDYSSPEEACQDPRVMSCVRITVTSSGTTHQWLKQPT